MVGTISVGTMKALETSSHVLTALDHDGSTTEPLVRSIVRGLATRGEHSLLDNELHEALGKCLARDHQLEERLLRHDFGGILRLV